MLPNVTKIVAVGTYSIVRIVKRGEATMILANILSTITMLHHVCSAHIHITINAAKTWVVGLYNNMLVIVSYRPSVHALIILKIH